MIKAHIISHTHWDREWYKSFDHFRVRLLFFMDNLIELMEKNKDFTSFLFDAQSVILDDYLAVKPQNKERLKKLIEDGRIIVGPWYTQPDEFTPDGESLIRNLIIGIKTAEKFGKCMKVGYLPDSFGHSSQLPQILSGFNIDSMVAMRGIPFYKIKSSEFKWKGINGDSIIGIYLKEGYFNACFLPNDYNVADSRIFNLVNRLKKIAGTQNILVMNGIDHEWPQVMIPDYIQHLNKKDKTVKYVHSNLEEFISDVKADVKKSKNKLPELEGELITPENSRTHTSMASTRMYQKKENGREEKLIERYVEPICSLGWILGAEYPSELIELEWKYLLQNQAHDSICGCCTDDVHKEIDGRFASSREIGFTLLKTYSRALARNIDSNKLILVSFNNSMTKGKQLVKAKIVLPFAAFELFDQNGNKVKYQIDKSGKMSSAELGIWASMSKLSSVLNRFEISFYVDFKDNFGFSLYEIRKTQNNPRVENTNGIIQRDNICTENKFYKIKIFSDGVISIFDKETNLWYKNLNILEDCGDAGDTYNFSPIKNDCAITSLDCGSGEISMLGSGPVKTVYKVNYDMIVPQKLLGDVRSSEKVKMPVEMEISIYNEINRIDVKTTVENTAKNHRLRVLFDSNVKSSFSLAGTQFGVIKRDNRPDDSMWIDKKWSEKPMPIYHNQKFAAVTQDGMSGIAVLNKDITEYEVYENKKNTIALTLIRSVGFMGKRDLAIRPGRASGMEIECPDAQCLGTSVSEYSIVPFNKMNTIDEICKKAKEFNYGSYCVQNRLILDEAEEDKKYYNIYTLTNHIENQICKINVGNFSLVSISDDNLMISAMKKAEKDDGLILRLYNTSESILKNVSISFAFKMDKVIECNFNEDVIRNIDLTSSKMFTVHEIRPYTAATFNIKPALR